MKNIIAICCILILNVAGIVSCSPRVPHPRQQTMTIGDINATTTGHIRFEEFHGKIRVTTIDRYGDAHLFFLEHDGLSKDQTMEILKKKQEELDRKY